MMSVTMIIMCFIEYRNTVFTKAYTIHCKILKLLVITVYSIQFLASTTSDQATLQDQFQC